MKCELCGTPVKVVGKTTQHYEPVMDISEVESPNLQRLIVLATKWIPKDHHDWEELQNMGWEGEI